MTTVAHRKQLGRSFEKDVAQQITEHFGFDEGDVQQSNSGTSGTDIRLTLKAKRAYPYYTECKNHKTLSIPAWIRQADAGVEKQGQGLTPIVVFRQRGNKKKKYVVMRFQHLLDLLGALLEGETQCPQTKNNRPSTSKQQTESQTSSPRMRRPMLQTPIRTPTSKGALLRQPSNGVRFW